MDVTRLPPGGRDGDDFIYRWVMAAASEGDWDIDASEDVGIRLMFAPGTFIGADQRTWEVWEVTRAAPTVLGLTFSLIAAGAAVLGLLLRGGGSDGLKPPGVLRDAVRWLPPWFAAVSGVGFVWRTSAAGGRGFIIPMRGDTPPLA